MPTETTQPVPPDSLDAQLDALLNLSATEQPAPSATPSAAAPQQTPPQAEQNSNEASIEDQLKSLLAGELAHVPDGPAPSSTVTPVEETGVVEASKPPEPPPPPVVSPPAPMSRGIGLSAAVPSSVEDLDSQLASLTETLLAETNTIEAEESAKLAAAAAEEASRLAAANAAKAPTAVAGASGTESHSAPRDDVATHSPKAPVADARPASGAGQDQGKGRAPTSFSAKVAEIAEHRAETSGKPAVSASAKSNVKAVLQGAAQLGQTATPFGMRALTVLNKPLEGKSASVRDSLGWVAVWTLFLAVSVWTFAVFFQKPPQHAVPHDAPKITSDEPDPAHTGPEQNDQSESARDAEGTSANSHGKNPDRTPDTKDHGGH